MLEKKLWKRVDRYIKLLNWVPFLRMVAVCNNLAFGTANENSDIDLFIVAKKGRLFTVRIIVTGILHVLGARRHGSKIEGRFCLSFFVDDSALDLGSLAIDRDIYLAFWVKSMKPIIDDGVSSEFLASNPWILSYFKSGEIDLDRSRQIGRNSLFRRFFAFLFGFSFGDFIENKLSNWQLRRARMKAINAGTSSDLLISEHVLKFHNVDRRREYRNKWLEKYGEKESLDIVKFRSLIES